jgi:hypothetical protein
MAKSKVKGIFRSEKDAEGKTIKKSSIRKAYEKLRPSRLWLFSVSIWRNKYQSRILIDFRSLSTTLEKEMRRSESSLSNEGQRGR